VNIEKVLRRFEDFAWGRRGATPEDMRFIGHAVGAEDVTPWVWGAAVVGETPPAPLDLAICWRDNCGHPVSRNDDVGLCSSCVKELRDL
jgi:hypothetical protein